MEPSEEQRRRRLLVVDDDPTGSRLLGKHLESELLEVDIAESGARALAKVEACPPDVVILDLNLPGMDGLEVLRRLQAEHPNMAVIVITDHGEIKTAVRAIQLGAFAYLTKQFDYAEVTLVVRQALERKALLVELDLLRSRVTEGDGLVAWMGTSPQVMRVVEQVQLVADSSFTVLIQGETGTGKELVAQALHRESARRMRPLITVDCGAIPHALLESELFGHEKGAFTGAERGRSGHFQLAEGGTLFLDEVANLPLVHQAKLLRVLESRAVQPLGAAVVKPIDVRFVAATNLDLHSRVQSGDFREDLYFRLAQFTIDLPPLRERIVDIPLIARRFREEACIELRRTVLEIAPDAIALLQQHHWSGNVRELRNVIRQAVLQSVHPILDRSQLAALLTRTSNAPLGHSLTAPAAGRSLKEIADTAVQEAERAAICDALRASHGNQSHAARALQIDYKTLHTRLKRYRIEAKLYGPN